MSILSSVKIHPVVLFTIIDSFERRSEKQRRIIGSLLGVLEKNGVLEITNCFTVPHQESEDEVALDLDFASNMALMLKKVNEAETVVGWFSTNHEVTEHDVLIHEFYVREAKNPVFVTIDTSLRGNHLGLKAFTSSQIGVPDATQGLMFSPVSVSIACYKNERVGLGVLQKSKLDPRRIVELDSDLQQVSSTCGNIQEMISQLIQYVDGVLNGDIEPNPKVGRSLLELVDAVPQINSETFQEILNSNMKDLLMIVYLANLTKTQLNLSSKIALL